MRKKLLLINPPIPFSAFPDAGPHMGLMYLWSFIKSQGFEVDYLNLEAVDSETVIIPEDYEFYGLTAVTPQYHYSNKILAQIKRRELGKTILGGVHASVLPESCLQDGYKYVVTGYGELALLEILKGAKPGIIHGVPVENLDALPFPETFGNYNVSYGERGKTAQMLTMRGCPYGCYYCCSKTVYGSQPFFRSVENVILEVEYLVNTFGITHLYFFDACWTFDRPRAIKMAKALKKTGVRWSIQTRVDLIDPQLLKVMAESGCDQISLGIETGSKVIERLGKQTTENQNASAIRMCHDAGIKVKAFLIGGLPDDTERTVEDFKGFLLNNRPNDWLFSTFTPFPGTRYWSHPEEFGIEIYTRDSRLYYPLGLNARGPINIRTKHLSREKLYQTREDMLSFLRKEIPNSRVEWAIELFPKQRLVFDKALGDFVY